MNEKSQDGTGAGPHRIDPAIRIWAPAILFGAATIAAAWAYRSRHAARTRPDHPEQLIDRCNSVLRYLEQNTAFQL